MLDIDRAILNRHRGVVAVTVLQAAAGLYFVFDVLTEWPVDGISWLHSISEAAAALALWLGVWLGLRQMRGLLQRNARMHDRLQAASGAFLDLLEESFARWGLTPSERDVALLSIKGVPIAEIAALRNTREGTVKAQCTAVYRKAGVNGRAQLLSLFIDDLMAGVVLSAPAAEAKNA